MTSDEVGVAEPHLAAWCEAPETVWWRLVEVVLLNVHLAGEPDDPRPEGRVRGMVWRVELFYPTRRVVSIVTLSGLSTASRQGARSLRTSRIAASRTPSSTVLLAFETPTPRMNRRTASGGTPRRRRPASVGILGSSQPATWPSRTSSVSARFERTVCVIRRRANSYSRGRDGTGRLSRNQSKEVGDPRTRGCTASGSPLRWRRTGLARSHSSGRCARLCRCADGWR